MDLLKGIVKYFLQQMLKTYCKNASFKSVLIKSIEKPSPLTFPVFFCIEIPKCTCLFTFYSLLHTQCLCSP